MTRPKVSVIFSSYNQREFVGDALESVVTQDYDPLEVIVGDDGSSDGSYEVLSELAARWPERVRLLPPGVNRGPSGIALNRNRCLAACTGQYIAYLDGDDLFLPGKIRKQVDWLEADPRRVMCGHDMEAFESSTGRALYRWSERFGLVAGAGADRAIRLGGPYGALTTMIRADVVPRGGFDARVFIGHDWLFWIECLYGGGHFGFIPEVLARYRRHPESWTTKRTDLGLEDRLIALALVEARQPSLGPSCRRGRATAFFSEAVAHMHRGDWDSARTHFANARQSDWRLVPKALAAEALTRLPHRWRTWIASHRWPPAERSA